MTNITFDLKEKLDKEFRKKIAETKGFHRGALQESLEEAIKIWLKDDKENDTKTVIKN